MPIILFVLVGVFSSFTAVAEGLTEAEFREAIHEVKVVYDPIIAAKKRKLVIYGFWDSKKVNAQADRIGKQWIVSIHGGVARKKTMTQDGLKLILCHELGHHLAGYPFKVRLFGMGNWSSAEGAADYFSTQVCARKLWRDEFEINDEYRATVDPYAQKLCDQVWADINDQNLCYRIAMESRVIARVMRGSKKKVPDFDTPDSKQVKSTLYARQNRQCRLDTLLSGALCNRKYDDLIIPGLKRRNSKKGEEESAQYTCMVADGYQLGTRPRCWFKPKN